MDFVGVEPPDQAQDNVQREMRRVGRGVPDDHECGVDLRESKHDRAVPVDGSAVTDEVVQYVDAKRVAEIERARVSSAATQ